MNMDINIVFLGDSFTNRTGVKYACNPEKRFSTYYTGNYAENVMKRLFVHFPESNFKFYNKGISGDSVSDLLDRYDKDVLSLKPNLLVLLIGYNDAKKKSYDKFINDYSILINKLENLNIKVICLSILPVKNNFELNNKIIKFNKEISKLVNYKGFLYIDIFNHFYNILKKSIEKNIYLYDESNHLSELGNIYIADRVYDAIFDIIKNK